MARIIARALIRIRFFKIDRSRQFEFESLTSGPELPSAINNPGINRTVNIRIMVLVSIPRAIPQSDAIAGMNAKHMPIPNLRLQCMVCRKVGIP